MMVVGRNNADWWGGEAKSSSRLPEELGASSRSKWPVRHRGFALPARPHELTCRRAFIIHSQLKATKGLPPTQLLIAYAFWPANERSGGLLQWVTMSNPSARPILPERAVHAKEGAAAREAPPRSLWPRPVWEGTGGGERAELRPRPRGRLGRGATHTGCAARSPLPPGGPACARPKSRGAQHNADAYAARARARRPGRRHGPGARGGGGGRGGREGEGSSARESRRQRETRGRKRACAPPPASGRRSRSSSGSSCRSRCSWETRQRGRACSGPTGSLPSPSLRPPLPQTHFRSSRPGRRGGDDDHSGRRQRSTHLTGPAGGAPARDRSPAAARSGRPWPRRAAGTGDWDRNAERPLPLRPPSRLPSPPPLAKPRMERPGLAAAWLPGWFCQAARAPAPGAVAAPAPRVPPPSRPPPRPPRPGAPRVRARRLPSPGAPGRESSVAFVATAAAGTVCELRRLPPLPAPSRSPGRGRHVGPGTRWRCALTCRRCGRGGA